MAANFVAESIKLKKMKLAEALCVRADLQKRIMQIEDRLKSVVKIQEGDVPITRMIARKDALTLEVGTLRNVLKVAAEKESRYSRNEIKYVRTVDTVKLRKKIDSLSAELRKVDLKIQESNWMFELEPLT